MAELNQAPTSFIPTFQNVEAAGQVGRAAQQFGESLQQLGGMLGQIQQRKAQQNEAYLQQRLRDIAQQQELDSAEAQQKLSQDPEAVNEQAKNFVFGPLKSLQQEFQSSTVSPEFRKVFNEQMANTGTMVDRKAALTSSQWAINVKSDYMKKSALSNMEKGIPVDVDSYVKARADMPEDMARLEAEDINQKAGYYNYLGKISESGTKQDAEFAYRYAIGDETLSTEQKLRLKNMYESVNSQFQMASNKAVVEAAKQGISQAKVALASQTEQDVRYGIADIYVRAADAKDASEKGMILKEGVDKGWMTPEQASEIQNAAPEDLRQASLATLNAQAKRGEGLPESKYTSLFTRANAGSLTMGQLVMLKPTMSDAQYSELRDTVSNMETQLQLGLETVSSKDKVRRGIARILTPEVMSGKAVLSSGDMGKLMSLVDRLPRSNAEERDTYVRMASSALAAAEEQNGEYQRAQYGSWLSRNLPFTSVRSNAEIKARDAVFQYLARPDIRDTLYTTNLRSSLTEAQNRLDSIWSGAGTESEKAKTSSEYLKEVMQKVGDKKAAQVIDQAVLGPAAAEVPTDIFLGE